LRDFNYGKKKKKTCDRPKEQSQNLQKEIISQACQTQKSFDLQSKRWLADY